MNAAPLIKKLRIQSGHRVLIINAPSGFLERLTDLPAGVELANEPQGEFDFVLLFVRNQAELQQMGPAALTAAKFDGLLWISYPKRSSKMETDITRDQGWEFVRQARLRPVTQVSIDPVWSALRFRPEDRVGK